MKQSSNYMAQFHLPICIYERLLSEAQEAGVNRSEYLAIVLADLFGIKGLPLGESSANEKAPPLPKPPDIGRNLHL